ncbi:hypothetical protein QDY71_01310 [Kingella negevensis]|uniref:hypothetical protein n=1 Tax=Kingella negevensis TaxID=1522312 RepID=UPI00117AC53E|nr:hypothetical protein [Kingella negevensis]MDK4680114.1 hypothetical protein [Kingella negevensis]MDK4682166.1 hypothetical protein [Kingella negevensis]MDK4690363.1 hypothetical protein [Kingella negevensis]MDK4692289.1 hypothetical protein [Kingella negevensis]MDK4696431.1 hypothetical protein [Kingella negevensis]
MSININTERSLKNSFQAAFYYMSICTNLERRRLADIIANHQEDKLNLCEKYRRTAGAPP